MSIASADIPRGRARAVAGAGIAALLLAIGALAAACGEPAAPAGAEEVSFSVIGSGRLHSCGLAVDGRIFCWGLNDEGQLGDGSGERKLVPTPVASQVRFMSLSVGWDHTCAVAESGAAYCWGEGKFGKLGYGEGTSRDVPTPVVGGLSFASVDAGLDHTCGVTVGGEAYCWGLNDAGQLGASAPQLCPRAGAGDPLPCSLSPLPVSGGHAFASVDAGGNHTCGIRPDGVALCWGDNRWGQLGTGVDTPLSSATPLAVSGPSRFSQIVAAIHGYTCGVGLDDGLGYCWGHNDMGQLGRGARSSEEHDVSSLPGGVAFRSLHAAIFHTCGLAADGAVYCWGQNPFGLGHGGTTPSDLPIAVAQGLSFQSLAVGAYRTCGIASDGIAYCWGSEDLGDGTPESSATPVRVAGQPGQP